MLLEELGFRVSKCLTFFVVIYPSVSQISGESNLTLRILHQMFLIKLLWLDFFQLAVYGIEHLYLAILHNIELGHNTLVFGQLHY